MATTAQNIIDQALYECGVVGYNGSVLETPDATVRATGLLRLQGMIDSWGADILTIYTTARTLYTLTSGTSTVTIGSAGTIAVARPVFWIGVNYVIPGSSPAVETPMGQMDDVSYMNLAIKGLPSSLPTQWYYNSTFPLGTLFFWPTVTQNVQLALYYDVAVAKPAALADTVEGPPGYFEAFLYGLALRLCNTFARPIPPGLMKLATDAFAIMRRPNVDPGLLGVDAALVPSSGGGYNVYSDQQSSSSSR